MPKTKDKSNIPFFPNTPDDTHCFQACLKSILKFYFPKKEYSFSYLDRVTAHKKGKWTWDTAGLLFLQKKGFSVTSIADFSYKKFIKNGEKYLKEIWTEEIFYTQKKFSDLKNEQYLAKKLSDSKDIKLIERPATISDIKKLFNNGWIVMPSINPFVINNKKDYANHIIIITNLNDKMITFHDSGLPPLPNRKIPLTKFLKAFYYPDKESGSLIAIKYEHK